MQKSIVLVVLLLIFSCNEQSSNNEEISKGQTTVTAGLSEELYLKLSEYQKLYPYNNNRKVDLNVYEAFFFESKNHQCFRNSTT